MSASGLGAVVAGTPLQVVPGSFKPTASGFSVRFNEPIVVNATTPVLYGDGFGATGVAPSVTLTEFKNAAGKPVDIPIEGSIIYDPATYTLTFLATNTTCQTDTGSPVLAGAYIVDLRSTGFQALGSNSFLGGQGTGSPNGSDYINKFLVPGSPSIHEVVWVPATAAGPGQSLAAPGCCKLGQGLPIYLNDTTGNVTSVQVTLTYNPTLLTVTPTSTATYTVTVPMPGTAVLVYTGPALTAGAQTPIGFISAAVPWGAATSYGAEDVLHLSGVKLNGSGFNVATGDGLHVVAYLGDAACTGSYSAWDSVLITRALLQTDSGFAAYPRVDPVIIADTDGGGFIPADAALQVLELSVGLPARTLNPVPSSPIFAEQTLSAPVDVRLIGAAPVPTTAPSVQQAQRDQVFEAFARDPAAGLWDDVDLVAAASFASRQGHQG